MIVTDACPRCGSPDLTVTSTPRLRCDCGWVDLPKRRAS
jgi:hypothetical protein